MAFSFSIKTYFGLSLHGEIETIFFVLSVDGFGEFVTIGAFVFPGFVELFLFAILFTFFVFFVVLIPGDFPIRVDNLNEFTFAGF